MKTASCRFCNVMNELLPGICGMKVKQVGDLFHLKNVPQMPDFYLKHIQIWPWPLFIHAYLSIYEMNNYYHWKIISGSKLGDGTCMSSIFTCLSKCEKNIWLLFYVTRKSRYITWLHCENIIWNSQWKFSSQKGMKNNLLAKAGLEPGTAAFPQRDAITIEPYR